MYLDLAKLSEIKKKRKRKNSENLKKNMFTKNKYTNTKKTNKFVQKKKQKLNIHDIFLTKIKTYQCNKTRNTHKEKPKKPKIIKLPIEISFSFQTRLLPRHS